MPKRFSTSVKKRSIPKKLVVEALEKWAKSISGERPEIVKVGYFGSYARGDYGPSSDLDILLVISMSDKPAHERILDYPVNGIPIATEVFPFTASELTGSSGNHWRRQILSETIFLDLKAL